MRISHHLGVSRKRFSRFRGFIGRPADAVETVGNEIGRSCDGGPIASRLLASLMSLTFDWMLVPTHTQ
jgi:hypothetical protein